MHICKHYLVSGRVQGVFYRASTAKTAKGLGLSGWVKNLPDGRVELVACGDESMIEQLEKWLWQGPSYAKVKDVCAEVIAIETFIDFGVRY